MLGLPTETEEDMKEIAHLAEKVARRYYEIPKEQRQRKMSDHGKFFFLRSKAVHSVPVGTDVYQAEEYMQACLSRQRMSLRQQLNRKSLKYNWHEADVTVLEGVMARGDRKVGKVIEEAYRLGCLFDSWSRKFS